MATDVLSGERADDRLYLPAIDRVREGVGRTGLLYVGDCKMASLETRAGVAAGGDFYLCPLPAGQTPPASLDEWLAPIAHGEQALSAIERWRADGQVVSIAEGFEWTEERSARVGGRPLVWPERRLLVRSLAHAQAAETALRARLAKAQAALDTVAERTERATRPQDSRRSPAAMQPVQQAAAAIVAQYRVAEVLHVACTEQVPVQTVPAWDGRVATVCDAHARSVVRLTVTVDEVALQQAVRRLGWRVYVTNQPASQLSLEQAVLAYRDEYLVERSLGRLKGQPLSLTPMYLTRDDHATGLVRLLSLGLRVLTLLEYTVRRRLTPTPAPAPPRVEPPDSRGPGVDVADAPSPAGPVGLAGLYPGAPTRVTRRPTAERLLSTFDNLTLTVLHLPDASVRHLTPLSPVQQRLLTLLDCPQDTYSRLTTLSNCAQPP